MGRSSRLFRFSGAGGSASYPDSFFVQIVMSSWFTGMGAGLARWAVRSNPLELAMPPCLLYQRFSQYLQRCVPHLGVWPRRRLALLVIGLLLGIMLAIWCAVLLGEASVRAGEIPAYGRRDHAVSLLRRGLDWLTAPAHTHFFRWTLDPPKTVRI